MAGDSTPDPELSDVDETAALLERHHRGDREALRELMCRDLEWIRRAVHKRLDGAARREAETDDVVQEVVLRTLLHGPRFVVSSRDRFRRLVLRIARNEIVSMARRRTRRREPARERNLTSVLDLDLGGPTPPTSPASRVADEEERQWIRLALRLLSPADAELIDLRVAEELSFPTIGRRLEITADAARMRFGAAVRRLDRLVAMLKTGRVDELLNGLDAAS